MDPENPLATAASALESTRNPRLVTDAFVDTEAIRVGDLELHAVSLGTLMMLERLDSPLIDDTGEADISAEDFAGALFVLTRHVPASLAILRKGRDAFDLAVFEFAAKIPAGELRAMGLKVKASIARAFSTVIAQGDAAGAGDEKKTSANSSARAATASAGG